MSMDKIHPARSHLYETYHAESRGEDERNADHVNGHIDRVIVVSTILQKGSVEKGLESV